MKTVQLSDQVTSGKEQWLSWHANFSANRAELLQKVCTLSLTLLPISLS